jgi:hypothetical protein
MLRIWRRLDIEPDLGSVGVLILGQPEQCAPEPLLSLNKVRLHVQLGDQFERRGFGAVTAEISAQPAAALKRVE